MTDSDKRVTLDLQSPLTTDTENDATEFEVIIPLYRHGSRDYVYASEIEVAVENAGTAYNQYVYSCELYKFEQISGWQNTIEISNGARGEGGEKEILFPRISDATIAGAVAFQYAVPTDDGVTVDEWSTDLFSGLDFLSLISRDIAVGIALPRIRKSGTLNVPASQTALPVVLTDYEEIYTPETLSWNIISNDLDITVISVPDAAITVVSETVMELPAGYSSGGSGNTGGGGGTSDYNSLTNQPMINSVALRGNKTARELGLIGTDMFELDTESVPGKTFIRAKYDGLYSLGSIAAGGPGTSGGGGSTVVWNQIVTTGTKIATITIDGETTDVYAPNGGGASSMADLSDVTLSSPFNYQLLNYENGIWKNKSFDWYVSQWGLLNTYDDARINANWCILGNKALEFYDNGAIQVYGSKNSNLYRLNISASGGLWVNGVQITGGGGSSVSWGTDSDGIVQLTVDGVTKYLVKNTVVDNYLLKSGGTMTGDILPNSTSVNLGSSAKVWGKIYANRWYPNANDTTHYIEYTTNGFVVHGNIAADGQVAAGA